MIVYQDLTQSADDFEFSIPPQQIWMLVSLEFPILVEGKKYLLMVQPYYGDYQSQVNLGEGILYPPFTAFPVEIGYFKPRTLGELRQRLDTEAEKAFSHNVVDQLAYNLGLGEPYHEKLGVVEEYKISPRDHDAQKFFQVHRYRCWHNNSKGRRNLSDPEVLKGHFLVPLELELISDKDQSSYGPHDFSFLSKPLASHFNRIRDTYLNQQAPTKITVLEEEDLVNLETGYVVHLDLSGFGNIELNTREFRSNPMEPGRTTSRRFRFHVASAFEEFFQALGTSQSRIMGDGFVCGVPSRLFGGNASMFYQRLDVALTRLSETVSTMNENLNDDDLSIGVRLTLEEGEYVYGRVGGPTAISADFDGETIIDVARCDQAITDSVDPVTRRRNIILGTTDSEIANELMRLNGGNWESETEKVEVKERSFSVYVSKKEI